MLWPTLVAWLLAGIVPGGSAPAARPQGGQAATRPSVHQQEGEPVQLTEQARRIHRSAIVIDGHNDLPDKIREKAGSSFDRLDLRQAQADLHTDIPRLRRGGLGAQFWSAYVPPETARTGGAARHCLEQIDLIHRMARRYPEHFEMAYSADD
ncbi:MAG: membrane dipeptidase, partial [Planctomycetota bacterium]